VLQVQARDGDGGVELPYMVGEDFGTASAADAARWVRIYAELVALHEDRLAASRGAEAAGLEPLLDRLRARLDDWRQRHLALAGMDFDAYARLLNVGGRTVHLTRREAQLLDFLLERPGQFFTSEVLIRDAWEDERLAPEQVRTYIVRLRRKLEESHAPARLANKPRLGYALNVEPAAQPKRQRPAS
jgi:DNA-binding winged helix-turn-helix (wHTH) protein